MIIRVTLGPQSIQDIRHDSTTLDYGGQVVPTGAVKMVNYYFGLRGPGGVTNWWCTDIRLERHRSLCCAGRPHEAPCALSQVHDRFDGSSCSANELLLRTP